MAAKDIVKSHKSKIKDYYNYLTTEKNVPRNIAIGILSQIHHESSFDPSLENTSETEYEGSSGLFQWMDGPWGNRGTQMKDTVGKDWKNNWKKQLDYFLTERKIFKNETGKDIRYSGKTIKDGEQYLSNRTYYNALKAFSIGVENIEKNPLQTVRKISKFITDRIIKPGDNDSKERYTQIEERGDVAEAIHALIPDKTIENKAFNSISRADNILRNY